MPGPPVDISRDELHLAPPGEMPVISGRRPVKGRRFVRCQSEFVAVHRITVPKSSRQGQRLTGSHGPGSSPQARSHRAWAATRAELEPSGGLVSGPCDSV